ncbi:PAS domain-containing protein [Alishewanella sp. d11]|uniref:PAS domain-containing protein n=1 Tax=Alishewanella sp. d11 TaxID=3414030 RepID=UPI003BF7B502
MFRNEQEELQRLAIIAQLREKSVTNDPRYARILRLAQSLLHTPVVLISLVAEHIQWFHSKLGTSLCETARADAFCAHAINQEAILVIEDAMLDPRFVDNPLVTNSPFIRFYAGAQIRVKQRFVLGTLCVIDVVPRKLSAAELMHLQDLAAIVAAEFEFDLISEQIQDIHKIQLLTECITRVQAEFILAEDRRKAFDSLLIDILSITDSSYGFIGEVLYDAYGMPYLKTFAITDIAWDTASRQFYAENAPSGFEFRNLNTLFGYTLLHKQVMIANEPATHPHAGGTPTGHPPLNTYLGIPIFFDGELIAMIGLANKLSGYHEKDVEFLRPLTSTIGQLVYATQIKRQQRAVQQQLNNIVEASEIGTWTLDLQTELLEVNARWVQMLGYELAELPELSLSWMRQNMHPADLKASRESVRLHLEGVVDFYESQFRIKHKAGHWVWVQARGRVIAEHEANNQAARLYGINIDITAEKSLKSRLTKLAENVPGMVYQFQLNPDQSIIFPYVGPAVETLLGFSANQLAIKGDLVFSHVHPEDYAFLHDSIMKSAQQLTQWQFKFRLAANGNDYRWLAGQSTPEKQDNGAIVWHGYIQDVTEETEMQLALAQAKEQAERAVATKSSFLANMSHEIRTPMNGVIGMLDILEESNTDLNQAESITLMRESAYSLLTIIDDILDFSKLEAGKLNIVKEPCALVPVIEQICSMLDYLALKNQVELTYHIDPSIGTSLWFDPNRLRQIIVNLLSNAIKFSTNLDRVGQVRLAVKLFDNQQDSSLLNFTISDNGIGMAPEVVARLFQPFTQADDSTSRKYGGTGLGLAITQQLVHLMDGVITAQSTPGVGSTFNVNLPIKLGQPLDTCKEQSLDQINIIILGESSQQTLSDYASYLLADGAKVQWLSISDVQISFLKTLSEKVVWVFDTMLCKGNALTLVDKIKQYYAFNSRFVIIGRGRRRKARRTSLDTVYIDANVLQRTQLVKAITAAYYDHELPLVFEKNTLAAEIPQQRFCILVLEDNSTNQKVIKQQLTRLGYTVVVAEDGLVGLSYTRMQRFDLILSDLHMPHMDGYQFVKSFREAELGSDRPRTPVIALTANIVPEELRRCKEMGMDDYLVKPLPVSQLKACLESWLSHNKTEPFKGGIKPSSNQEVTSNRAETALYDPLLLAETVGEESVIEILQDYSESLRHSLNKIEQALLAQSIIVVAEEAHKLKSSSRFIGAAKLADAFCSLEQLCIQQQYAVAEPDLSLAYSELKQLAEQVLAAINKQITEEG